MSAGQVTYIYDDVGRLAAIMRPDDNEVAVYHYDQVGNLLSISRNTLSVTSIIHFSPQIASHGQPITIRGTGFSVIGSENRVLFNDVPATVLSADPTQVVAVVPVGATSGAITVTTPAGSATSAIAFTVVQELGPPVIADFTPAVGTPGTSVVITGN